MFLIRFLTIAIFFSCFNTYASTNGSQEQIQLNHPNFEAPLKFNVALPSGYNKNKEKSYILMFDFHHYADTYLRGMHDWLSHNGEWRKLDQSGALKLIVF